MLRRSALLLSLALLVLAGCNPPPARENWKPDASAQALPLKSGTRWVIEGGWAKQAERSYALATRYIEQQARILPKGSWAVAMDIDETVLSNIAYHQALDTKGATFAPGSWRDWVEARAATPVPGVLPFIQRVNALGGHVALVTNRRSYEEAATIDNLNAVGMRAGRDYAYLVTRPWPDGESDKTERFAEAAEALSVQAGQPVRLIAYFGDQSGDKPSPLGSARFFCIEQGNLYGSPCEFE